MTVTTLRAAIALRAAEMLPEALVLAEQRLHKNHLWRECPCSYCETKRRATFDIGTPPMGHSREWRESYRHERRIAFRKMLASEAQRIDYCPTTSHEPTIPEEGISAHRIPAAA